MKPNKWTTAEMLNALFTLWLTEFDKRSSVKEVTSVTTQWYFCRETLYAWTDSVNDTLIRLDFIFPSSRKNIHSSNKIHVAAEWKTVILHKPLQTSGQSGGSSPPIANVSLWFTVSLCSLHRHTLRRVVLLDRSNTVTKRVVSLSSIFNVRCCLCACGDSAPPAAVFFRDTDCSLPQHIVRVLQRAHCF